MSPAFRISWRRLLLRALCAGAQSAIEHYDRGLFALRDKQFADAVKESEAVPALDPAFPDVDLSLGLVLFQTRDYCAALDQLLRARAAHPGSPELLLALGTSLAHAHQNTEAQRVFEEFLRLQPDTAELHVFLGQDGTAGQH